MARRAAGRVAICLLICAWRVSGVVDSAPEAARPNAILVTAFGADPKGTLDSTQAFDKALGQGKPVWVPAGRYRLKSAITLPPEGNVILEAKPGTAVLFADPMNRGGAQGGILLVGVKARNVMVRGLIFDGNGAAMPKPSSPHTRLVFIDGGTNVVFSWDAWRNSDGSALVFSGVHTAVSESGVRHSHFSGLGFGWKPPAGNTLAETAPVIVFANGLKGTNQNNLVSDNEISHVGSDAISVQQQEHFVAERNKLTLNQEGWKPNANDFRTYGIGGFYVFNGNDGVVLRGNVVTGATGNCFDLAAITELEVTGNTASNCGGAGISIGPNIHSFQVTKNVVTSNYQSAGSKYPNIMHEGGISFGCGKEPCQVKDAISNGVVNGNTFDKMGKPTQPFNAWRERSIALNDVKSDVTIVTEK